MTPSQHIDSHPTAAQLALAVYREALQAVRADRLTLAALHRNGDRIEAGDVELDLGRFHHVYVVGAGKAAAAMAAGVEERLGDRISAGVAVTKDGHAGPTRVVRMLESSHPVPDERSVAAGRAIFDIVAEAGNDDLVLVLLSGGASALVELPAPGVSLADIGQTTALLLSAGATIREVNTVRSCLSQVKAGGLARAAAPATVLCLVLSDVLGNALDVIASGPCLDVPLRPEEARCALEARGLWTRVPEAVRAAITGAPTRSGASGDANVIHVVIGDIWSALRAAERAAGEAGLRPAILTGWMQGEAREVAQVLGGMCRDLPTLRAERGLDCLILGGETTVTVRGPGKGGRSQEIACVASDLLAGVPDVALLAAGTDGTDGPTDAAGGVVDGTTKAQAGAGGWSPNAALRASDTYAYLAAAGGLIKTGPTYSNVGDLVLMVIAEPGGEAGV